MLVFWVVEQWKIYHGRLLPIGWFFYIFFQWAIKSLKPHHFLLSRAHSFQANTNACVDVAPHDSKGNFPNTLMRVCRNHDNFVLGFISLNTNIQNSCIDRIASPLCGLANYSITHMYQGLCLAFSFNICRKRHAWRFRNQKRASLFDSDLSWIHIYTQFSWNDWFKNRLRPSFQIKWNR